MSERTSREYWWAWTTEPSTGRIIILGPYNDDSEANQEGMKMLKGLPFEVTPLRTRDRLYAKSQLNYRRLEGGTDVEHILKRARYKV